MTTVTKALVDNDFDGYSSSAAKTWNVDFVFTDITVTDSTFSFITPAIKAKYSGGNSNCKYTNLFVIAPQYIPSSPPPNPFEIGGIPVVGDQGNWFEWDNGSYPQLTSGTVYTIPKTVYDGGVDDRSSQHTQTLNTSTYFNSSNKTSKTLNVTGCFGIDFTSNTKSNGNGNYTRYITSGYYDDTFTIGTVTLKAPPTFNVGTMSSDDSSGNYYVGTTASVSVSSLSAKYGGDIASNGVVLTIGNQTAKRSNNGTLSITLNAAGTFTPTVKVTDSRGQVTTKTLASITVAYRKPTCTATVTSSGTYLKSYSNYSVSISNATAYHGTISSIQLKVGSQTASRTTNGPLSISLNTAGTFTPTVTITDSVGNSTTYSLSAITVVQATAPTFTVSALSKDQPSASGKYYIGNVVTTVSVTISDATASYSGTIASSKLTIGNQSVTGNGNGTLSITLNATGTFTPTVRVTDSRGLYTDKTLASITVTYAPPKFTASVTSSAPYIKDYIAGAYTVQITGATASTGSISSSKLELGSQSVSGSGNGTLSITPAATGTFTPKVTVTDSGGRSTTKSLTAITVQDPTPPTFTASVTSSGSYVRTKNAYTVSVSSATASYGGTIVSSKLTLGSQTATGTGNGTLSITPNTAGTFTPTVTVTDNRGLTTTKNLTAVTILDYKVPTLTFSVIRCDSSGKPADEGTCGLVTASVTYSNARCKLNTPTVTVKDKNGSTVSLTSKNWYTTYSSASGVSNKITFPYQPSSPVTMYCLLNDSFTLDPYTVSVKMNDNLSGSSSTITQTLPASFYTMDFQAGGKEISFGAPANDDVSDYPNGLFKCQMDARFNGGLEGWPELVVGTQTASTGSWTGVSKQRALFDGMQINYWLPYAGSGNATLNLTLAGGNTTGAIPVYWRGETRLTTHYPAGSAIKLTYRANAYISGTAIGAGWWADADYNTNTYTSAYCTTAAGTAAKTASCSDYNLLSNSFVLVTIVNTNTAQSALTLSINSKTAKPIYINGAASSSSNYTLNAGTYLVFYDGTNYYFRSDGRLTVNGIVTKASNTGSYHLVDSTGYDYYALHDNGSNLWIGTRDSSTKSHTGKTYISAGYGTSAGNSTLYTAVPNADNTGSNLYGMYHTNHMPVNYATCSTAAGTAEKVAIISTASKTFELAVGSIIGIKFTNTNTAENPKINVKYGANGATATGAKSVWYNTAAITTSNLNKAGYANRIQYYMYDGTYWVWMNWSVDSDTNTAVTITTTNPTSSTTYYPVWHTAASGTSVGLKANNGLRYISLEGAAASGDVAKVDGYGFLYLGNNVASGTDGNKYGQLRLFSKSTGYARLQAADDFASETPLHYLPKTGGTLLNTGTTSYTQTLTSGTKCGDIKINGTTTAIYAPAAMTASEATTGTATTARTITAAVLQGKIASALVCEDVEIFDNKSISKSSNEEATYDITKSGYTPIGIVGYYLRNGTSSGQLCSWCNIYCSILQSNNRNTVEVHIRNTHTSSTAKVKLTLSILYVKSS